MSIHDIAIFNEFLTKTDNILLKHVLKMPINDVVQLLSDIRGCCNAIGEYLMNKCNWNRYSNPQFKNNSTPNNTDMVERGHGIASYALRSRFGLCDENIECITLCKYNHLMQKIIALNDDTRTKPLFNCIFEHILNGRIKAELKNNRDKTIQVQSKRSHYLFNKIAPNDNKMDEIDKKQKNSQRNDKDNDNVVGMDQNNDNIVEIIDNVQDNQNQKMLAQSIQPRTNIKVFQRIAKQFVRSRRRLGIQKKN
jgi:hypothetical protein